MAEPTVMTGLEHGRAAFAYAKAEEGRDLRDKSSREYKSYVKKVPMLIKANGLGATCAFIKSKAHSNKAYGLIYKQTAEWLRQDIKRLIDLNEKDDLVARIVSLNSFQYRAVTSEVLALFDWLRRFAEGLIEGEDDNNG
ncbi:MAG: type III-B CRISPR module-associated protein Cmr5 [Bacillota bacterium]